MTPETYRALSQRVIGLFLRKNLSFALRNNWGTVLRYSHVIDIVVILAALVLLHVARHVMRRKKA